MKTAEEYIKQFNLYEVVPKSPEPKIYFNERIKNAINTAINDVIYEIDLDLAQLEDYLHGEEGMMLTKLRAKILSLIKDLK